MGSPIRLGDQRVCAVCARVLNRLTDLNEENERWDHSFQDQPADHVAIPVFPDEIITNYRCDFCNFNQSAPSWVIPANDFKMPGASVQDGVAFEMSTGDWGACEECGELIAANDWAGLLSRVSTGAAQRSGMPQDMLAVRLARMYHRLRANMTGDPYRVENT